MSKPQGLMTLCWWLLAALQIGWHAVVAPPTGTRVWWLALLALSPLLMLAPLALKGGARGRFWGMFLVMLYFMVGITEAWSNPAQRVFAMAQVFICLGYFGGMVWLSRRSSRP